MKNWQEQQEMVQKAKAQFPKTFALRHVGMADTTDRVFRLSDAHSYVNDYGTVILYVEIQDKAGNWLSFSKGTVEDLNKAVVK